jgi:hypothetical protein
MTDDGYTALASAVLKGREEFAEGEAAYGRFRSALKI